MSNDPVLFNLDENSIATITLNRPQLRNAFDDIMISKLISLIDQVANNSSINVLVLKANGKHFSAGADLNWMMRTANYRDAENLADAQQLAELMRALNSLLIPTVALIQGAAYGGAVGLAACCDMVFATTAASFCLSEVKLGLIPAVISPYVINAIGARQARRYFISAESFSADTAKTLSLVHQVVDDETQLQQTSELWLSQIINNSPMAMRAAKLLIADVDTASLDAELIHETAKRIADIRKTPQAREGLAAFLEKRKPNWHHSEEL